MSPTVTTSSEVNGNVSAATARAAAKAAATAESTGPQTITLAKALNTAMADAMHADSSVLVFGEDVPVDPQELFKYVFSDPTPQLKEQSAMLADELSREEAAK